MYMWIKDLGYVIDHGGVPGGLSRLGFYPCNTEETWVRGQSGEWAWQISLDWIDVPDNAYEVRWCGWAGPECSTCHCTWVPVYKDNIVESLESFRYQKKHLSSIWSEDRWCQAAAPVCKFEGQILEGTDLGESAAVSPWGSHTHWYVWGWISEIM